MLHCFLRLDQSLLTNHTTCRRSEADNFRSSPPSHDENNSSFRSLSSTSCLRDSAKSDTTPLEATTLPTASEEAAKADLDPRDPLATPVTEQVKDATEQVKEKVEESTPSLEEVKDQAQGLKEKVEDVVEGVKEQVASAVESVSGSIPTTDATAATEHASDAAVDETAAAAAKAAAEELNSRTVFVGGLSWNVDNAWLEDEVYKALDLTEGVVSARISRNPMGKSRGFAFVELATVELAQQLAGQTPTIDGRDTEFRLSTAPSARPPRPAREPRSYDNTSTPRNSPSNTIWIGNVSWGVEESELDDAFSRFGDIQRVSIPRDSETGRSRGIGYIQFATVKDAISAVELGGKQGVEIDGRVVRLDFAADRTRGPGGDGAPRRGGGGGRGGFGGQRRSGGYGGGRREGGGGGYGGGRDRREGGGGGRDRRDGQW